MSPRILNTKHMGDACEMLVAGELTLAGVPAVKMPDNWPFYDVTAFPEGDVAPQRISVKSRTFKRGRDAYVEYNINDGFDWLAIVLLPNAGEGEPNRRFFIIPRTISDHHFHRYPAGAKAHDFVTVQVDAIANHSELSKFENNFCLSATGTVHCTTA
jgi:hypothetical protein